MKDTFTIGEISNLLQIPKSTLRYWDEAGLLHQNRNQENHYREYTLMDLYEITDIAFYRNLQLPMKQVKDLYNMSPIQLEDTLSSLEDTIDKQIRTLQQTKKSIAGKKNYIEEYRLLEAHPYQLELPDINQIISFPFDNTKAWQYCLLNPDQFVMYIETPSSPLIYGMAIPSKEQEVSLDIPNELPRLWTKQNCASTYITSLLWTSSDNHEDNNLQTMIEEIKQLGYEPGHILARYLFTALDNTRKDYHKAWIQVTKKENS